MYGTVARIKLQPGKEAEMIAETQGYESLNIDGFVATAVYRADSGDNEYWLAVIFKSKEKYRANAESPEQDARFQKLAALMAGEPEWHDGEVIARQVAGG
jgi:heme-degrading monooxygenase HmoA